MTKQELIEGLASHAGVTGAEAERFLAAVSATVLQRLKRGELIQIPKLGIFELVSRKARTVRHPKTGKPVAVPASTAVHFRPSASFKRAVNP